MGTHDKNSRVEVTMRRLRSLTVRLILSHILVAALTSVIAALVLVFIFATAVKNTSIQDYQGMAVVGMLHWLLGAPDGQPNNPNNPFIPPKGFGLVISKENMVLFSQGDTKCRAEMKLEDCAPELIDLPPGERFFDVDGQRWIESVNDTVTGQRAIARRSEPSAELYLGLPGAPIYGNVQFTAVFAGGMALFSIPVSLILTWFTIRPLARRLTNITRASKQFAAGDFSVRVQDRSGDKVGELARQFDDMADALDQNMTMLRDMAQRNADLAQQVEQVAIQAERVRLSRDLHDAIAQRLFSLSVSTSTLPDLIRRDQDQGVQQAQAVASLAEQTLLDLRALLVELRPTSVMQRGLTEALQSLCGEWQAAHRIPIEHSFMLTGKHIPASIEDVIYRVTQEALSNAAKHANATQVHVSLVEGRRQITLSVTDNGHGFNPDSASISGRFGLLSMQERARSVGGTLAIESDTTQGTTIRMTLPLERDTTTENQVLSKKVEPV